jgi:fluoride exporter
VTRVALVALGGAFGSVARYGVGVAFGDTKWPAATLAINVVGSFLLGVVLTWGAARLSPDVRVGLAVGVLGGFTTYSTFSHDAATLDRRGAALYVVASVALGVAAALAGRSVGERLV